MYLFIIQHLLLLSLSVISLGSAAGSSIELCHNDDRQALLAFKAAFAITNASNACGSPNAKTHSWKSRGKLECCQWEGVTCDPFTGHVTELHLSCSLLTGTFPSNSSLFRLRKLRHVDLSFNSFSSSIPPGFGRLSYLTYLDLSYSGLSGQVPPEIGWLSRLNTLDLSGNVASSMPDFKTIISNLTDLTEIDLTGVMINTDLPPTIANLSKLTSLGLSGCGLQGSLPAKMKAAILERLSTIDFSDNKIIGTIPAWLFTLPSLSYLHLEDNVFTGLAQSTIANRSFTSIMLGFLVSGNHLQGKIPEAIFQLHNLQVLDLGMNNMTATILVSELQGLRSLNRLLLSNNNLSIIDDMGSESISSWPSFEVLELSSCNLGHFPVFLRDQRNLTNLELSNSGINGPVPEWLSSLTLLNALDLSFNSLTGGLENLPWLSLIDIDIRSNKLEGAFPIPLATTSLFYASNNKFSGEIPSSLCHLPYLELLDVSHNNLTGNIPVCFASLISSAMIILDLSQNELEGVIPSTIFEDCPQLFTFRMNGNRLEGPIPKSLNNCMQLQLLDLGSNNLNDTFPQWLDVLPGLEVLILGSNVLHGSLMNSNTTNSFPMLRILDISSNDLTGFLSAGFLMSMKRMVEVKNSSSWPYMSVGYYQDSMNAWFKGSNHRLDAILNILVAVDASRNRLEGSIPDAVGDLISLRWLNLAHNNFTGNIPPSLGNLSLLESLDLSFNRLDGEIPNELVNLNSLGFFNVSENNLVGPVPTGKQFDTFLDDCFLGNPGLCGSLLTKKCGKRVDAPNPTTSSEGSNDESSGLNVWEISLMGYGFGMFVASVWGYFIFWAKNPYWVVRLIFKIEVFILLCKRRRRQ